MDVIKTEDFLKGFRKLPKEIQSIYLIQEEHFRGNWRDPRLHIEPIKKLPNALAFRITRRYRAFFYFRDDSTAIFFDIDHRKDIYR